MGRGRAVFSGTQHLCDGLRWPQRAETSVGSGQQFLLGIVPEFIRRLWKDLERSRELQHKVSRGQRRLVEANLADRAHSSDRTRHALLRSRTGGAFQID